MIAPERITQYTPLEKAPKGIIITQYDKDPIEQLGLVKMDLLVNGDSRSVLLFGGLGIWAVFEIVLCNKRDGAWRKPDVVPFSADMIVAVIAAVAFGAFFFLHKALFGVLPY